MERSGARERAVALGCVVLIIALAFAVRLIGLDRQSIWDDEGSAIFRASLPLGQVASMVLSAGNAERVDTNPPAYFLALAIWLRLTGTTAFAVRYLSVWFGCIAVAATFALARRLAGFRVGLAAIALATISPFYVYYAQEARMYALLAALATLYVYAVLRARDGGRPVRWALAGTLAALGLYTHYYMVFLVLAVGVWLVIEWALTARRRSSFLAGLGLAHLAAALLVAPWIFANLDLALQFAAGGGAMTLPSVLGRSLLAFSSGNGVEPGDGNQLGALYPAMHRLAEVLALPFLLAFGVGVVAPKGPRPGFASLAVVPAVLLVAAFGRQVDFTPRYLTVAAPPFLVVVAAGVVVVLRRSTPAGLGLGLVLSGISAYAIWHGAADPAYWRPDVRAAVGYLEANAVAPSAVVVNAGDTFPAYLYYRSHPDAWVGLPAEHPPDPAATDAALARLRDGNREIWVLLWGDYYSDPRGLVEGWLDTNAYPKASASFPGGVRVVGYTTGPPIVADPQPVRPVGRTLGDTFELVGYDPAPNARAGSTMSVRLYWEALAPVSADLTMFAQLHDRSGKLWAQSDGRPHQGLYPTERWVPNTVVAEDRSLHLPPNLPPGHYHLDVGWYDLRTMQRVGSNPSYLSVAVMVVPPGRLRVR